ncbi:hypothetical protein UA08_05276 [Talaromyces atroroseus]|uniref:Selenoprotein W-like protein n=1 Tax=Talaromyces atroroseus TaxID=1441469 RepID=A0A225AXG6_TALAT|nr:hypothetical protein UA08_05276 [Talaromyces atroroseus]OKL59676.1 hypothetical protein UA08_05276 [Talaromyces atroroseus]
MTEPVAPIEQTIRQHSRHSFLSHHHQYVNLPRITIKYCTQCKWMLRAAYFAQELLSTFSTTLGEVSLVPATGGVFTVTILHSSSVSSAKEPGSPGTDLIETLLWDRKTHGGFPEVKHLKSLVRNIADPTRSLGHVDRALEKANQGDKDTQSSVAGHKEDEKEQTKSEEACEDCQ